MVPGGSGLANQTMRLGAADVGCALKPWDTMIKFPLRLRLPLLVAGTTLPLILFAAGLVYVKHVHERDVAFDRVLETARGIQLVLDSEMRGITLALEVLANSHALQNDDLSGFRNNAEAFFAPLPDILHFTRQTGRDTAGQ